MADALHADGSHIAPLNGAPRYEFRLASTDDEIAQVQRLLYKTFVVEVPRYDDPGGERLVDRFHRQNRYFVALRGGRVCGTMATHDRPPYSFADALADPTIVEGLGSPLWEARILAVEPSERFGLVFGGLAWLVFTQARSEGCRHIAITGLASRQRMYERMGFAPLGPPVLRGAEHFVPMAVDLSSIPEDIRRDLDRWARRS